MDTYPTFMLCGIGDWHLDPPPWWNRSEEECYEFDEARMEAVECSDAIELSRSAVANDPSYYFLGEGEE